MTTTDAQAVWRKLSDPMRTSSRGVSEKRRLTQYVTNTALDDNFKGTTEQFVLYFNERLRQLDEISDESEKLVPTVKLTLLHTAVRSINDLRIVETLGEFQSTTHGHGLSISLSYQTYYDLLINACVRYDKTRKANIGKRRNVYNSLVDPTYVDYLQDASDFVPESPYGGIDLPPDEFYQIHALLLKLPCPLRTGNMAQRRAKQHKVESKNRPEKDHQSDETEEIKAGMMCWGKSEGSLVKEPYKETDDQEGRADEEMLFKKMKQNMLILHYIQATN